MSSMAVPVPMAEKAVPFSWTPVELKAAELLGQGMSRSQVATKMEKWLITKAQQQHSPVRRRRYALRNLRRWQKKKEFRDLVWEHAVEHLDSRTPRILEGVAHRAEAGRVDAAKLGLEIAGRYTPKGQDAPTNVVIAVNGVPRPMAAIPSETPEVVEGEAVEEL